MFSNRPTRTRIIAVILIAIFILPGVIFSGSLAVSNNQSHPQNTTLATPTPIVTTAAQIISGIYPTRDWATSKHVYLTDGTPAIGQLVTVKNLLLSNVANGAASQDCNDSTSQPPLQPGTWCDSTADGNDGTGLVHMEIDQVDKSLGIAPPDWPGNETVVDATGYTFYDGESGGSPSNPVTGGWEIHPVMSWSLSGQPPPPTPLSAGFTATPSSPIENVPATFVAKTSGGTAPFTYTWSFGDGGTGNDQSPSHAYSSAGTYTVILTVTDGSSPQQSAAASSVVTVIVQGSNGGNGGSGRDSNGSCTLCGVFPVVATSFDLLVIGGILGLVGSLAILALKARSSLEREKGRDEPVDAPRRG